ncbi:MAG: hypothetical protein M1834_006668 [Cirrosporium novae-zelandiae]|nr:MAG: hypothetical protein M1834_006668 [Cirrosporium novae-zelandiae]
MPTQTSALYALGSNKHGQLGTGHVVDASMPQKCIFDPSLPDSLSSSDDSGSRTVPFISAGANHTLVLFDDGAVFAAGDDGVGQCGFGGNSGGDGGSGEGGSTIFKRVEIEAKKAGDVIRLFKACAATWESSVLVTMDSGVYVLGSGDDNDVDDDEGQTMMTGIRRRRSKPRRIEGFPPSGVEIVSLASSMAHVVVVLSNGEVHGWGNGSKGQLGEPRMARVWPPRRIEFCFGGGGSSSMGVKVKEKEKVLGVTCGKEFTFIYGYDSGGGIDGHAMLGGKKWGISDAVPTSLPPFMDIRAGWNGVFVLRKDGGVVSWGRNNFQQLGPRGLEDIRAFAPGSEHVVALTGDGKAYLWGWGEHGNCGPFSDVERKGRGGYVELEVGCGMWIEAVGAGCATSFLLVGATGRQGREGLVDFEFRLRGVER